MRKEGREIGREGRKEGAKDVCFMQGNIYVVGKRQLWNCRL